MFRLNRIGYYIGSMILILNKTRLSYPLNFRELDLKFYVCNIKDVLVIKEVLIDKDYEQNKVKLTPHDKVVVDIGGGVGDFAIYAGKKLPSSKIYTFEPNSKYFELIEKNKMINRIRNVGVYKFPVAKMETVFNIIKRDRIDFLKIDCEGCEYKLITPQAVKYLKRVNKIALEYHDFDDHTGDELVRVLVNSGFKIAKRNNRGVPRIGIITGLRK